MKEMKIRFLKTALPVATFLLFGLITLGLWDHEIRNERNLVRQHTETIADQIKIRIEGMMNTRMSSLQIFAERWVERIPPDFSKSIA